MLFESKNNKILELIVIFLVVVLAIILIFLFSNFKKSSEITTYPFKTSFWERFLAEVSYSLRANPLKRIEVDISRQKLKLFEGDKLIKEFSVSTGRGENSTPTGTFKVYNKSLNVYSRLAKCWLGFWVGFTPDGLYGFHQLPICQGKRKGLEELGKPASLGCVRLGIKDSRTFYEWVKIGMPVLIYEKAANISKPSKIAQSRCYNFNKNLRYGNIGEEVKKLQKALEKEGFDVSKDKMSRNIDYFGVYTLSAIINFQEKYKKDILAPWGLERGTGFVGPTTRNKLNKIYGCQ